MRKICALIGAFLLFQNAFSQTYTVSGTVTDAVSGEHLISAGVYNSENLEGTVSNYYGYYSLKQKAGKVQITCSYLGYKTFTEIIELKADVKFDIALEPSLSIDEVIIESDAPAATVRSTQTGVVELPVKSIKHLPVLLGETDVIKGLQLMPGIQGGTEGTSGLYVRGGSADQNLILLDGVPVYNVNHLFGIFSVFNGDALNSVTMYKSGFPARFGGRLSSVLDIRMKEGNREKVKADATVGILASKLTIDGPVNDKTTFLLSGRRTYADLLTYPFQILYSNLNDMDDFWAGYFFYDFNGKISHRINDNNRIYLSAYTGADKFFLRNKGEYNWSGDGNSGSTKDTYDDEMGLNWGNITTSARWNHLFRSDVFSNVTLTYSRFKFKVFYDYHYEYISESEHTIGSSYYEYFSKIQDLSLNHDIDYAVNTNHYLRMGYSGTLHLFSPGVMAMMDDYSYGENTQVYDTASGTMDIPSFEGHAYIEDEFKIGSRLMFNLGMHYSNFSAGDRFYHSLEPRTSGRLLITDNLSFKLSYVKMKQYLMLLTGNSMSLPTDLWIPVNGDMKPQESWQLAGGFSYSLNNKYLFTLEGFYKEMKNVTEYKEGAGIFNMQGDFDQALTQGYGEGYGAELFIKKSSGKTTGWISYTLSWANRHFGDISNGQTFPYKYDRRHQLNIVLDHKISERWNLGAVWVYGSGYPLTLGNEKFVNFNHIPEFNNPYSDYYSAPFTEAIDTRNNYRMPHYHRLDLNFNSTKIKKQRERTWSFGTYNTYFRQNPFMVYKGYDYNSYSTSSYGSKEVIKQLSILVFVPYIRWNIKLNKITE